MSVTHTMQTVRCYKSQRVISILPFKHLIVRSTMPTYTAHASITNRNIPTDSRTNTLVAEMPVAKSIIHVIGNNQKQFTQAVIGPLPSVVNEGTRTTLSGRNITHLLVERRNGQLLALRLLDLTSRQLSLSAFMERLEKVLPRYLDDKSDRQVIEGHIYLDMLAVTKSRGKMAADDVIGTVFDNAMACQGRA